MKQKTFKPRLPMDAVILLRTKGGAHSTPKGKKGYNRNAAKAQLRKETHHV